MGKITKTDKVTGGPFNSLLESGRPGQRVARTVSEHTDSFDPQRSSIQPGAHAFTVTDVGHSVLEQTRPRRSTAATAIGK